MNELGQTSEAHYEISEATADTLAAVMDREVAAALERGEHYWVAVVLHRVNPPFNGEPVMMDLENLRGRAQVGCFICEDPLSEDLIGQPCPGMK